MYRRNLDIIVTISIALVELLLSVLPFQIKLLQLLFVLPLVLFIPGYLVTEALFQRQQTNSKAQTAFFLARGVQRPLDNWEYITLSIGLSFAIDIVGGFLLNLLPIGMVTVTWTILLCLLTIVLSLAILVRRFYYQQWSVASLPQTLRFRLSIKQLSLLGVAALIMVFAIIYSVNSAAQQPYPGFTQFWMLPHKQNTCAVQIGIHNFEGSSVAYRVNMTVNGKPLKTWTPINLDSQQEWNQAVPLTSGLPAGLTTYINVDAQLYRLDKPQSVYRQVHVQLPIIQQSQNGQVLECGTAK